MQSKIIMNKKAQEYTITPQKTIFYMVLGGFITVMVIILLFVFTNENYDIAAHPQNLEINLIKYRIINSECFLAIQQKTNQLIKAIDWNKFNQNTMDSCIIANNENSPQYKIVIIDDKGIEKNIQTKYFVGSSKSITLDFPIFKDNKVSKGKLKIEEQ